MNDETIVRRHKFTHAHTPGQEFSGIVYCKHCGFVVWHQDYTDQHAALALHAAKGCPLGVYINTQSGGVHVKHSESADA